METFLSKGHETPLYTETFLSAEQLSIDEQERDALIQVLSLFETGEIVYDATGNSEPRGFNLESVVSRHEHGVCACIVGWAKLISEGALFESPIRKLAFEPVRKLLPKSEKLSNLLDLLFGPIERDWNVSSINTKEAAVAIRNYLTMGRPFWDEIISVRVITVDTTGDNQV